MEAAAAAAKRMKRDPIDAQETPESSNGDGSLDLISRLPDEVVGTVISLLPTKDGARTPAVSRAGDAAPLNLQGDGRLTGQDHRRVALVSRILSDHPGPARRFALRGVRLRDCYARIDSWLRSRGLSGLLEFVFGYVMENPALPPSAFRFAPTLRVASVGYCDIPTDAINYPLFGFGTGNDRYQLDNLNAERNR
ncbi:hypothetical protein C2845_PM03G25240 [Panicum miliaceum]|uniref:F-box protein n=1 Tax=Panicum miliaceum TaxID=4540 RepID=A0A3L6T826_PANMI|nr:hypothetical protein C2845_PM03G25240 [Panicum miliaceum]